MDERKEESRPSSRKKYTVASFSFLGMGDGWERRRFEEILVFCVYAQASSQALRQTLRTLKRPKDSKGVI